jgi:hypothetical protein
MASLVLGTTGLANAKPGGCVRPRRHETRFGIALLIIVCSVATNHRPQILTMMDRVGHLRQPGHTGEPSRQRPRPRSGSPARKAFQSAFPGAQPRSVAPDDLRDSRDELVGLLARPWSIFEGRHLDAVVSRLRRKIERRANLTAPIKVVYGVGYMFTASVMTQNGGPVRSAG